MFYFLKTLFPGVLTFLSLIQKNSTHRVVSLHTSPATRAQKKKKKKDDDGDINNIKGRKKMFYSTTHSTHFNKGINEG